MTMKRIKGLFGLGAAVAAALTLGACSQDETAGGDGALCPMELTATGLEPMVTPMTRATVDGDWSNVTKVAVEVDGVVKAYDVDASGSADKKTATLKAGEGVAPFYWPASGDVTVSAWPYNGANMTKPDVVVESDQSGDGYAASDFIEAVAQSVTKDNNALVFEHRTAKICVKLKAADDSPLTGAVVSIAVGGQTVEKCFASDGGHLALIAPTAAAEELTVKIAAGGKNYVYKYTPAVKYEANSQYTFNLKLKGDEVALSRCTITGWNETTLVEDGTAVEDPGYTVDNNGMYHVTSAKGLKAWAEAVANFSVGIECELENDIEMPAVADGESNNWTPISSFAGTFDGNGKTITGLVVNKGARSDAGFIVLNYGTVKNLTLKDAEITGTSTVGAVAVVNSGTIENCHVTGESVITGEIGNQVGGVVSMNYATILACHVAKGCKVSGKNQVGGIAGDNYKEITGCYALCSLTGDDEVGGISGCCIDAGTNASITACYSKCSYDSGTDIGGIVGYDPDGANFSACYYANCTKGVGNATTDPSGVTPIGRETTWTTAWGEMNNNLTGYEFYNNPDSETYADEPLVLKKTNE